MRYISFKKGYKYQLAHNYEYKTKIRGQFIQNGYLTLDEKGILFINKGYAWDGPSGPTIDTLTFMRGALIHDALYQLIRSNKLPRVYRKEADLELFKICLEDGMNKFRAKYVYYAVRLFAGFAVKKQKEIIVAPEPR